MKKVLVIDDSKLWREFFKFELGKLGCEVEVAVDGLDGLNKFFSILPDVVIVDYTMPKMNGIHVARFIRSYPQFKNVGIVIITAENETINKFWAIKSGVDLYLKKSIDRELILSELKNFLDNDYHLELNYEVFNLKKRSFRDLLDILEESLRNELFISEIYSFLEYLEDERYLFERIYFLLNEIFGIISLHVLILNIENARVYSFSGDDDFFNKQNVKDILMSAFEKPVTSLNWYYNGNYNNQGRELKEFITINLAYKGNEQAVLLLEGVKRKNEFYNLISTAVQPLSLVAKLLNEYNLSKSKIEKDALTKVYSKAFIMEKLNELLRMSLRQKIPLSVAMIDIDDFKKVNDKYGHIKGDEVLKKVAGIISGNLRDSDYVGRYGGEEFLVIFPSTQCRDAKHVLERVLNKVREFNWSSLGIDIVTFSAGVCCKPKRSMLAFVKEADKNLYKAKRNGKNQICGGD
ncbi:diguanylate cyclase [Thermosipho affectus]|uniref:Diguanylate cyclase n=1 Tax=Thermosipho affectus TaxID=660294 RepID=A0ABX3IMV6_9BACT|nr:diguanylate cyclase [Thermosipho affectus]ONN27837.1 diguanylate cyclase [Thermosipho affectus]